MRALLAELGDPQLRYPAVHVVGTNGKSTTTRMTETLLADAGLARRRVPLAAVAGLERADPRRRREADFERPSREVRPRAGGATQFEVAHRRGAARVRGRRVDVAVVEAGLGGRHDATNVLRRASSCSRTSRSTTWTSSATRARRSPPRSSPSCSRERRSFSATPSGSELAARTAPAASSSPAAATSRSRSRRPRRSSAREVDPHAAADVVLPGRLERRSERPLEIWDGAHNLAGIGYLLPRLPEREYVVFCSILADKRPELMLEALSVLGGTLVATESLERALAPGRGPRRPRRTVLRAMSSRSPILARPGAALSRWRARRRRCSSRAPSIFLLSSVAAAPPIA